MKSSKKCIIVSRLIVKAIYDNDIKKLAELYKDNGNIYKVQFEFDPGKHYYISLLSCAALLKHTNVIKFLLKTKTESLKLHEMGPKDINPLFVAIEKQDFETIKVLLNHANALKKLFKDKHGNTPFHRLDEVDNKLVRDKIAFMLINAGLEPSLKNINNEKPQFYQDYLKVQSERNKLGFKSLVKAIFSLKTTSLFGGVALLPVAGVVPAGAAITVCVLVMAGIVGKNLLSKKRHNDILKKQKAAQEDLNLVWNINRGMVSREEVEKLFKSSSSINVVNAADLELRIWKAVDKVHTINNLLLDSMDEDSQFYKFLSYNKESAGKVKKISDKIIGELSNSNKGSYQDLLRFYVDAIRNLEATKGRSLHSFVKKYAPSILNILYENVSILKDIYNKSTTFKGPANKNKPIGFGYNGKYKGIRINDFLCKKENETVLKNSSGGSFTFRRI